MAIRFAFTSRRAFVVQALSAVTTLAAVPLIAACGGTAGTSTPQSSTAALAVTASSAASGTASSSLGTNSGAPTTSAASALTSTSAPVTTTSSATVSASATTTVQSPAAESPVASASAAGVAIKLITVVGVAVTAVPQVKGDFAAFEAQHPGITVDQIETAGTAGNLYDEKVDTLLASGTPPALWYPAGGRGYRYYAYRNALTVLDPYIARDKFDLSDFFPVAINFCKWNGQYVALPVDLYTQVLLYNQTMFNNLGVTPPTRDFTDASWTWDKFLSISQQLTHSSGQPTAQYGTTQAWSDSSTLSWVYGGDWFEPEGYVTGLPKQFPYQADAVTAGMQFKVDCTYKYHVQPAADEAKALRGTLPTDFHTGRYGMYDVHFFTLKSLGTITSFDWRVAATPNPPSLPRRNTVYPGQWASFQKQQHPDEAWKLLSFMVSPPGMQAYPVETGVLSSRRSLAADWKKAVQSQFSKLTDDDLNTIVAAADHDQVSPSHAIVDFAQISSQVISPTLTKLAANQITADNALASMTPAVQKLLTQTT